MLSLRSSQWSQLRTATGSAGDIPRLLEFFQRSPSEDAFDDLWGALVGIGDIGIDSAFFAVVPHLLDHLPKLKNSALDRALGTLGWGIALAAAEQIPAEFLAEFGLAKRSIARLAYERLVAGPVDVAIRRYLIAAVAAGLDAPKEALLLVHADET